MLASVTLFSYDILERRGRLRSGSQYPYAQVPLPPRVMKAVWTATSPQLYRGLVSPSNRWEDTDVVVFDSSARVPALVDPPHHSHYHAGGTSSLRTLVPFTAQGSRESVEDRESLQSVSGQRTERFVRKPVHGGIGAHNRSYGAVVHA